jgi:hypothetical protein
MSKIKIDFILNNVGFAKNMQGYRCMMMHDAKKKITSNSNIGDFSGSLHMLSIVSSYLGRVVASDSKRGYLCSIVGSCLYLIWGIDRNF